MKKKREKNRLKGRRLFKTSSNATPQSSAALGKLRTARRS